MEQVGLAHGIAQYVHILLFVYWLGGDAGVYYASSFVVDPKLTRDQRMTAFRIFVNLDMLPRYCLALMLTVGGILAHYVGFQHSTWQAVLILVLGPVWVVVVHLIHVREGTEFGRTLAGLDRKFRVFMIFAIVASVAYHWVTGPLRPYPWLAAKLLLFAFLIFCGYMVRVTAPPFIQGYRTLASTGPTPESDKLMIDGLTASRRYVLMIWAGVALSALIGVLKPGQGPVS